MTMLPDVADTDYQQWRQQQDAEDMQRRIDALSFSHAADQQIATLPSSDALTNPTGTRFAAPTAAPSPPEQPLPAPEQPQAEEPAPSAPPSPTPSPSPPPPQVSPSPATPGGGGPGEWFGQALGAVEKAGGDVQKFAANIHPGNLDFGAALTAAEKAGADVQTFASSVAPPPKPAPAPAAPSTPSVTAGAGPAGQIDASSHQAFVQSMQPYAEKWAGITGIPANYLIAWAASESNWGKAGNALFGIKQSSQAGTAPGLRSATWEAGQGATTDTFANYNTPDEAFASLDQFLQGNRYQPVYQQLREGKISPDQFMAGINQKGYATDPVWGQKIGQIARQSIDPLMDTSGQPLWQRAGNAVAGAVRGAAQQISQFGDKQLTADEAYAACGPAAAVRFASMFGRNPTLREATDLAKSVGWSSGQGMAGIASEQQLMDKMGIPTKLVPGAQWSTFAKEAQSGNPVTISTQGHYFFADGYDPTSGAFHVGRSGTDLRQGSEWMTPQQMTAVMGPVQGGLLADNPQVPAPSTADMDTNPLNYLGRLKDSLSSQISDQVGSAVSGARDSIAQQLGLAQDALGNVVNPMVDRQRRQFESDAARVAQLNEDIMNTTPGAPLEAAVRGVQGRVGEVMPKSYEDFTSRIQTPTEGWQAEAPGAAGLGRAFSAIGSAAHLGGEIGNEVNPFIAAGRLHAGEEQTLWSDPEYRDIMERNGITRDMSGGQQALAQLQMPDQELAALQARVIEARRQGAEALSQAAWSNPEREDIEGRYGLLGGLAAAAVAPQGLASGAGRFAASLALDPGSAPYGLLGEVGRLPELLRTGRMSPEVARIVESAANYPRGGLEDRFEQLARASAANSPDRLAHLDLSQIADLPYEETTNPTSAIPNTVASIHIPHLDDIRALVQNGLPFSQWYTDMAEKAAGAFGEHNLPEFATNFGITSQRTRVEDNLAESLRMPRLVREAAADAIANNLDPRLAALDRLANMTTKEADGIPAEVSGLAGNQKKSSIINAYTQGGIESAGPKTPSYIGNFLSAFKALFDPRTTDDTWVAQMMGVRGDTPLNRFANNDRAYRLSEVALNEIARELGIPGHQAQAAAWYSMQRLREAAPDLYHSIGLPRGQVEEKKKLYQTGGSTLGDALRSAQQRGIFGATSSGQASAWELPKVKAELAKIAALPDQVRFMDNPTGADMMRRYKGKYKGADRVPSSPEYRAQERIAAESGVATPTVGLPELPLQRLRDEGLLTDSGLLPALRNVPHRVTELADGSSMISLPGGNSDTAKYVASLFGDALGADRVTVTYPNIHTTNAGGIALRVDPARIDEVVKALEDAGGQVVAGTDRGSVHIPLTQRNEEVLGGLRSTIASAGDAIVDARHYTGEAQDVGREDFAGILQAGRNRFAPTGSERPDLLDRTVGVLREAGGGGGIRDFGSGRISAPDLSGGSVPGTGASLASIVSRGATEGLRSSTLSGAVAGGIGSGYQAAQDESATPGSVAAAVLGGALSGGLRGAGLRTPGLGRLASVVGRDGRELFDQYGRVLGKPTDEEAKLFVPGQAEGRTLGQIVDPSGELLSTVARGARLPGQPGPGEISDITRTALGAEQTADVQAKLGRIMPNLTRLAKDMPDVQASILRNLEENPALFDRYRNGPLSWDETTQLAEHLGMTTEDFLKSKVGQAFNPQEMLALRGAVVSKKQELEKLSRDIYDSGKKAAELSPQEKLDYIRTAMDASRLVTIGTGASSTTGRTLNILKKDVDSQIAKALTGGNEAVRAQKALEAAQERANRLVQLRERTKAIAQEQREALDQVAEQTGLPRQPRTSSSPSRPRASGERPPRTDDGSNILEKINRAYAELDAYQAMSLEEKGADWERRNAERLANAEKRRAILDDKDSPERLLAALQQELAGERKLFAGNKKTWEDLAFHREKLEELTPEGVIRGVPNERLTNAQAKLAQEAERSRTVAWLDTQKKALDAEVNAANNRAKAAHTAGLRNAQSQRNIAERILERVGTKSINDEMIDNLVQAMTMSDPVAGAKVLKGMQHVSNWNRFNTIRYGGLLASTATHLAQLSANTLGLGVSTALHPASVGFDIARHQLGRVPVIGAPFEGDRTRYMSEWGRMAGGALPGLSAGLENAKEIMRSGINPAAVSRNWEEASRPGFAFGQTRIGQRLPTRANDLIDAAAEGSLRLMEAGDALIRGGAQGTALGGLAERQAIREGYARGAARDARVQEIMNNIDEFPNLMDEANNWAARVVLQEKRQEVQKLGGIIGGNHILGQAASILAMPFVRTPANLTAQLLGMSPLGYLGAVPPLVKAAMTDIPKGQGIADAEMRALALARRQRLQGEFADRMARATFGTGAMYAAKGLADGGHLTGPYPEDPGERSTLPPGWQPWSFKFGLPGIGDTYIPFSNITGASGMPLALGASWSDAEKHNRGPIDHVDLAGRMASGFGRYMLDQSMLQGLSNVFDVIKDPAHKFENYIEGVGVQNAPGAGFGRQLDRVLGTSPRDPHGILEALEAVYPGLSGRVQAKMDSLGRPVQQTQTGLGGFLPRYAIEQPDDVLKALREADVSIGAAPDSYANYALSDDERQKIYPQQQGYYIQQLTRDIMQDPDYVYGTTEERHALLDAVVTQARRQAAADILDQLSESELEQRAALQAARKAPNPIER